jgi:hypothetical protein
MIEVGEKITSYIQGHFYRGAVVRIARYCDIDHKSTRIDPVIVWKSDSRGDDLDSWDYACTEGWEWCVGWEGPAVNALAVARAL